MQEHFLTSLQQGLVISLAVIGIYISFRILNFPDLTCDGSFALGGGLAAVLLGASINPYLGLVIVLVAGFVAGACTLSGGDRRLSSLVEQFNGVKPPRFSTVFEALVNAFSCQQLSLDLGIILLNRLAHSHGVAFRERDIVFHAFPRPEDLSVLSTEDLRKLSLSRNKAKAIIELSERVINKDVETEGLEKMSDAEIVQYLSKLRGVGRWSSEYVLLRGLGRISMFPGDDVGAQRNLQDFMRLHERPDYEQIKRITSRWQPYASFVYFHVLLDKLKTKGYLP